MKKNIIVRAIIFGVVALVSYYYNNNKSKSDSGTNTPEKEYYQKKSQQNSGSNTSKSTSKNISVSGGPISDLNIARVNGSAFTVLKNSRLVERKYGNDGDSFLVKHSEGETEFRLYFTDACESWFNKRYAEKSAERLREQGNYFGGLSQDDTVALGIAAKKYVTNLLSKKPFTVVTKWENVYGPDRRYAFVIVELDGEKRYLHEILVAKGLGRIHTKPTTLPDNTSASRQRSFLKSLESKAKSAKLGAWGIRN